MKMFLWMTVGLAVALSGCSVEAGMRDNGSDGSDTVLVSASQAGQSVVVGVGQLLEVETASRAMRWHADYESSIIEQLDGAGDPNGGRLRFRALSPGETQLILSSVPSSRGMAAPAMMRMDFFIKVVE